MTYQWPDDGDYKVSVTDTDAGGAEVTVGPAAVAVDNLSPTFTAADAPAAGTEGQPLTLSATADDPAGSNDALQYRWILTGPGGRVFEVGGATATFTPPDDGEYEVELEVSDREGGVTRQAVGVIAVADAPPTVGDIETPAGRLVEGDTVTLRAPAAADVAADRPGTPTRSSTPGRSPART